MYFKFAEFLKFKAALNFCQIILTSQSSQSQCLPIVSFYSVEIFLVLGMRNNFLLLKPRYFGYYSMRL